MMGKSPDPFLMRFLGKRSGHARLYSAGVVLCYTIDCIDYVTGIGNLHMRCTGTHCYRYRPSNRWGRKGVDLALQTSLLGVKILHSTAEVPDNMTKASGWEQEVAVLGMIVDARAQAKHWLPIDWMGVSNLGYVVYTIYGYTQLGSS